jgi:hypothetical protein
MTFVFDFMVRRAKSDSNKNQFFSSKNQTDTTKEHHVTNI